VTDQASEDEAERDDEPLRCSFCGKDQYQLRKLVSGPNVSICQDCVEVCIDIMADERGGSGAKGASESPVVGSIVVARCSLCRAPTPAADLTTVDTRGAVCERASASSRACCAREHRNGVRSSEGAAQQGDEADEARDG